MNLQDLGSLGEFIGSLGVIVTLVYLSVQLKQNTRAMEESQRIAKVEAMTQRMDVMERTNVQSALNPEVLEIRNRALAQGVGFLSELEIARLRAWELARMMRVESQFFQWENGLLDDDYYDQFENVIRRNARLWVALDLDYGRRTFREAVEQVLSEGERS